VRSLPAILAFTLLVSACAATEKTYTDLTRTGRGLNQLKMDGTVCDMALQQSAVGQPAEGGANVGLTLSNIGTRMIEQDNFFDSCMLSRGWERK